MKKQVGRTLKRASERLSQLSATASSANTAPPYLDVDGRRQTLHRFLKLLRIRNAILHACWDSRYTALEQRHKRRIDSKKASVSLVTRIVDLMRRLDNGVGLTNDHLGMVNAAGLLVGELAAYLQQLQRHGHIADTLVQPLVQTSAGRWRRAIATLRAHRDRTRFVTLGKHKEQQQQQQQKSQFPYKDSTDNYDECKRLEVATRLLEPVLTALAHLITIALTRDDTVWGLQSATRQVRMDLVLFLQRARTLQSLRRELCYMLTVQSRAVGSIVTVLHMALFEDCPESIKDWNVVRASLGAVRALTIPSKDELLVSCVDLNDALPACALCGALYCDISFSCMMCKTRYCSTACKSLGRVLREHCRCIDD